MAEPEPPACQPPDPNPRPAGFKPPPGAVDTHAHVFLDRARYPFTPDRSYTPPPAPLEAYLKVLDTLGIERSVLVQPSVYGTDNSAMCDVMAGDSERFRGIAVVESTVDDSELERMDRLGVRGVRSNLLFRGGIALAEALRVAKRIAGLGWHLQLLVDVSRMPDLRRQFEDVAVPLVFDHIGHLPAAAGDKDAGFQEMLALLAEGRAWVKLSGAYRVTGEPYPYADVDPLVAAILETAPERAVWATDWPHPSITGAMPNVGDLLNLLARWAPDAELRRRILVDNPRRLYGFP